MVKKKGTRLKNKRHLQEMASLNVRQTAMIILAQFKFEILHSFLPTRKKIIRT